MDILIHVSMQDLQRNLQRYIDSENSPLRNLSTSYNRILCTALK